MMGLNFKDINEWKPSSISIVDAPSHPLAVFEIYEDDEAFIRKYKPIKEENKMTNENDEKQVSMSEGFFERLFGGLVTKSAPMPPANNEPPAQPPAKTGEDDIKELLQQMNTKLDNLDERVGKLEGDKPEEPKPKEGEGEPVPGAVKKSAEGGEGETGTDGETGEANTVLKDGTINEDAVVSKSIDPDLTNKTPQKSFMERIGRSEDGMKWDK